MAAFARAGRGRRGRGTRRWPSRRTAQASRRPAGRRPAASRCPPGGRCRRSSAERAAQREEPTSADRPQGDHPPAVTEAGRGETFEHGVPLDGGLGGTSDGTDRAPPRPSRLPANRAGGCPHPLPGCRRSQRPRPSGQAVRHSEEVGDSVDERLRVLFDALAVDLHLRLGAARLTCTRERPHTRRSRLASGYSRPGRPGGPPAPPEERTAASDTGRSHGWFHPQRALGRDVAAEAVGEIVQAFLQGDALGLGQRRDLRHQHGGGDAVLVPRAGS